MNRKKKFIEGGEKTSQIIYFMEGGLKLNLMRDAMELSHIISITKGG